MRPRRVPLLIATACLLLSGASLSPTATAAGVCDTGVPVTNLLTNGGAEAGAGAPAAWSTGSWQPTATFDADPVNPHAGARSLAITAGETNDAQWRQTVPVCSTHVYRLSGWIRTDAIPTTTPVGASLGVDGTYEATKGIRGSTGWTFTSMTFRSQEPTVTIAARLGYVNADTTGRAWFDDIQLVDLTNSLPAVAPPWKVLVLVYPTTEIVYTDQDGVSHRKYGRMTTEEQRLARATARDFVLTDVPALNSRQMIPRVTVRTVSRTLNPVVEGDPTILNEDTKWTPDPAVTAPDHDPAFDSVIVIWNSTVTDDVTGTTGPANGSGGLTWFTGSEQTYSEFPLASVTGPPQPLTRNVYKHEWGHAIIGFFSHIGVSAIPTVNIHAGDNGPLPDDYVHCGSGAAYDWQDETAAVAIPNSIYNNTSGFTHDYYSGTTATPDQPNRCLGIDQESWRHGGPTGGGATPALSVRDVTANEGNSGTTRLTFTLTLATTTPWPVRVTYRTVPGTATTPEDFTGDAGAVTIPAGSRTITVPVTVIGDTTDRADETFTLHIDDAVNAYVADPDATATIIDDDAR